MSLIKNCMLQRIQTLYLFFAGIISLLTAYFFYYSQREIITLLDNANEIFYLFLIKILVSSVLSIVSIFLFRNRTLQINLGKLNILINFLLVGLLSYFLFKSSGELNFSEKGVQLLISFVVTILFLFLANYAIKKDEELVKSVDRLR